MKVPTHKLLVPYESSLGHFDGDVTRIDRLGRHSGKEFRRRQTLLLSGSTRGTCSSMLALTIKTKIEGKRRDERPNVCVVKRLKGAETRPARSRLIGFAGDTTDGVLGGRGD